MSEPTLKEEELANDIADYNHEIEMEQARDIIEFNEPLDNLRRTLAFAKIAYDEEVQDLLSDYSQSVINEFLIGE